MQVVQESLVQVGQMARGRDRSPEDPEPYPGSLGEDAPLAEADTAAIRDAPLGGLPVIDLSPLSAKCNCSIPGWAALVPKMARWMARRTVDAGWPINSGNL